MYGDDGLVFCSLKPLQILGCLGDEGVEEFEENLVGLCHDLLVILGIGQGVGRVTSPDHL